jgi:hypothetical protein
MRLTCAGEHFAPEPSLGFYFPPSRNGQSNRHVRELTLPAADNHVGSPRHCRMTRILSQHQAKGGVVRTRGHAPNCIAWVNVFKVQLRASLLEVLNNLVLKIQSHVTDGPTAPEKVPQSENKLPVARASSVVVKIPQAKVGRSAHAGYNLLAAEFWVHHT